MSILLNSIRCPYCLEYIPMPIQIGPIVTAQDGRLLVPIKPDMTEVDAHRHRRRVLSEEAGNG